MPALRWLGWDLMPGLRRSGRQVKRQAGPIWPSGEVFRTLAVYVSTTWILSVQVNQYWSPRASARIDRGHQRLCLFTLS
jgi:hypothetical protein